MTCIDLKFHRKSTWWKNKNCMHKYGILQKEVLAYFSFFNVFFHIRGTETLHQKRISNLILENVLPCTLT